MKKLLYLLLLLSSFLSAYADDDILYDISRDSHRSIRTKEVPFAISEDIPVDSYTMSLTFIQDVFSPSDTTVFYSLDVNIPSDRPHALPRHSICLFKGKNEKNYELSTNVEYESSDCKSFEAFGEEKWHICYTFILNEEQIQAMSILGIKKLRFQTPWNNSVTDIEESMFDNYGFSGMIYYLYETINKHLKISENIYDGF